MKEKFNQGLAKSKEKVPFLSYQILCMKDGSIMIGEGDMEEILLVKIFTLEISLKTFIMARVFTWQERWIHSKVIDMKAILRKISMMVLEFILTQLEDNI